MIIEVYHNGKWERYTTCYKEFVDFYLKDAKEFYRRVYGENVEVRARKER